MKPFSLEEYLNNPSRKVVTRDGRNVKIHCTNYSAHYPIIAEIQGVGYSDSFYPDGRHSISAESRNDLFFAPEKYEGWANVFMNGDGTRYVEGHIFESKEDAEKNGKTWGSAYKATIKIEWKEDEQ